MSNTLFTRKKLRAGTALQALALLGAGAFASAAFVAPAAAQDYTSGAITGTVTDDTGAPVQGATVTITSRAQGNSRTTTTSGSGGFLVNSLPIGSYDVSVAAPGKPAYRAEGVNILASQTAQLGIQLAGTEDIVVTGARAVTAFTGSTTGLNVDVQDFIKTKPLGRDLTSIILLSPGTTAGDTTFGNLPSIGGSSVAENAYYINGLNTTDFDNYLGSAQVPFYFYQSVETKVGGYPAEYGRATGGIVNATTKSGSNDYFAAAHIDWAPNFLRSKGKNLLTYDGTDYVRSTNTDADRADSLIAAVEASGPIIKDHLFIYGLVQFQRTSSLSNNPVSGIAYRYKNDDPFWGVKVDAYPIDSQHLEFTIFDTRNTQERRDIEYSYINGVNDYGGATGVEDFYGGGLNYVGKYTGRMTDWLTVSAAYGRVRNRKDFSSVVASPRPFFYNESGQEIYGVSNGGYFNDQRIGSIVEPYDTERKFFRADADVLFSLLGDHHIRGGYDQEINTLRHTTKDIGGDYLIAHGLESQAAYDALSGGAGIRFYAEAPDACTGGEVSGVNCGPVLNIYNFNTGGSFKAKNQAYYIQDEWKPFNRLTLRLGVRRDDFRVNKPSGLPIADLKKNYAPRIGADYTLFGNRSGKLFASYGWYYLPIASNTAFRQGAPSYYVQQRFYFQGVDADGLPILGNLVTNQGSYQTECPYALIAGGPTTNCDVTGDGADIDVSQAIASNLKATRESELIVGYEQKFGDLWSAGLSFTHRNLDRTAEDSAIDAAVIAYCNANGIVPVNTTTGVARSCSRIWTGFHQYVINNPGSDITVNLLANGYDINGKQITLTADQLGYGKAKRTYDAVTFTFDRKFADGWSVGGNYTWSKSKGNSEGYVQSDFGQTDAGITQDFDQPGFVDYSYGDLPNNRTHLFNLYGSVALSDSFTIGANIHVESPRDLSCFGYNPTDRFANGYGAASHYCGGQPSPRGTAQQSQWMQTINLQFGYDLKFNDHNIRLRADVFNLLNSQAITSRYEFGDLDVTTDPATGLPSSYIPDPNYHLATSYQAPRYVRLGVDIGF